MINEETIYEPNQQIDGKEDVNKDENPWKLVTLAGVTGIFMGAGLLHAGQTIAKDLASSEENEEVDADSHTIEESLKVTDVKQGISFSEAFAQARAEVGPGGVFHWHGGIYNTYTAEEWNAMSHEEKAEFAHQVSPEIRPNEVPTPSDEHPDIAGYSEDVHEAIHEDVQENVRVVENNAEQSNQDSDVHIVGYAQVQGHLTVGLDMDGDGQADVAIIDVDDNQEISNPDLVVDKEGRHATVEDIINGPGPHLESANDSPDIPEDPSVDAGYPLYDV
jgi:hypothetical protein